MQIPQVIDQAIVLFADQLCSEFIDFHVSYSPCQEITVKINSEPYFNEIKGGKIIRIHNECGSEGITKVSDIVLHIDWQDVVGAYIKTKQLADAREMAQKLSENLHGIEIFGSDPDYFQSLIPIQSTNRKNLERYVLALKPDNAIKEKAKSLIKRILIKLARTEMLYEKYIIAIPSQKL